MIPRTYENNGAIVNYKETLALPNAAGSVTTSIFEQLTHIFLNNNQYPKVVFNLKASAVSGTNIDVDLIGLLEDDTEVVIKKDLVTALTDDTMATVTINLFDYPYKDFKIKATVDADESANTLTVYAGYLGSLYR